MCGSHICGNYGCNCGWNTSYPSRNLLQNSGQCCNVSSMYRSEEEIMWCKVGVERIRGSQVIRPPLSIHFREIFRSKKFRAAMWNCGRSQTNSALLEKQFINNLLIQNPISIKNSSNVPRWYTIPFTVKVVKVMCTLVQALKLCTGRTAHRGSRGTALTFLDYGTRRGEGTAARTGRSLTSGKTRYPLYRRLGGPQGRSGQVRKISPSPGFDPRPVQPVYTTRPTPFTLLSTKKQRPNIFFS
jgi:hypothetical protein